MKPDINPAATVTTRIPDLKNPGPQDYGYKIQFMDNQSSFIDCKKRTLRGNRFSAEKRREKIFDTSKSFTPGPGEYQVCSAFG